MAKDRERKAGAQGAPADDRDDRGPAALMADLTADVRRLLREEIALAKAEFREAIQKLVSGMVLLVVGGVLANAGLNALVAAAVLGVATAWAAWLAALVVGVVVVAVGGAIALAGARQAGNAQLKPERTLESLQEDARAVREELT